MNGDIAASCAHTREEWERQWQNSEANHERAASALLRKRRTDELLADFEATLGDARSLYRGPALRTALSGACAYYGGELAALEVPA